MIYMLKKILILTFIILIGSYSWYSFQINRTYMMPTDHLEIEAGLGVKQISADLTIAGYIHSDFWFRVYIWRQKLDNKIQAGIYELPAKLNIKNLVNILTSHNTVDNSVRMTFIEGWNIEDIANYLNTEFGHDKNEFYSLVGYPISNPNNINGHTVSSSEFVKEYDFLLDKPTNVGLEGYIFPDTYLFKFDADLEDILQKIFDNFSIKLSDTMRADIAQQNKTIYEVVTIASILEREFQTVEDKKIGSGIIQNRLDIGMALQMDSTVNYATGKNLPGVTSTDLEVDSLYNTYKYSGLPPGPISNPGLDSLVAAIYPEETDYLYFLHDAEGKTYFAKTFSEHAVNKQKYLP